MTPLFAAFSATGAVLIGGQALNLWCEHYAPRAPELKQAGPFTSKDVDIQGDQTIVTACARALGVVPLVSRDMHDTTNAGFISVRLGEREVGINVLFGPFGVRADLARETSVPVDIGSSKLLVLNPVLCMEGRISNVAQLPNRDTEHDLRQARASIVCAREYIAEVAEHVGPRDALRLLERVFEFTLRDHSAMKAFRRHELDCFDAVRPSAHLPQKFATTRLPRMRAQLDAKRRG